MLLAFSCEASELLSGERSEMKFGHRTLAQFSQLADINHGFMVESGVESDVWVVKSGRLEPGSKFARSDSEAFWPLERLDLVELAQIGAAHVAAGQVFVQPYFYRIDYLRVYDIALLV